VAKADEEATERRANVMTRRKCRAESDSAEAVEARWMCSEGARYPRRKVSLTQDEGGAQARGMQCVAKATRMRDCGCGYELRGLVSYQVTVWREKDR
jgi:hypothetical protein